jgi:hypothetical protein
MLGCRVVLRVHRSLLRVQHSLNTCFNSFRYKNERTREASWKDHILDCLAGLCLLSLSLLDETP